MLVTRSAVPISVLGTQLSVTPEFRAALFEAEQGGADGIWKSNRHPFITSTVTGSIMNPAYINKTWAERMKLTDREDVDDLSMARMARGSKLESIARTYFEKMCNVRVYERGLYVSEVRPHTAVSPDGFVLEDEQKLWNPSNNLRVRSRSEIPTDTLVEIKCPSSPPTEQANGTYIRDSYIVQVMDAMDKLNCKSCYFVILETEQEMHAVRHLLSAPPPEMPMPGKLHVFKVHRSQAFIDAIRLSVDYFTSCLEHQVEPIQGIPFSAAHYASLFNKVQVDIVMQKDVPENVHHETMELLQEGEQMDTT